VATALATFFLVAALLTVTPGADTAVVLRSALTGGRRAAWRTTLGVCSGLLAWGVAAALGISALLTASRTAFDVLRLAGAAYLVYLGTRTLLSAGRAAGDPVRGGDRAPAGPTAWASYRTGLVSNLLNPKIGVFYVTFLPQFVPPGAPVLGVTLLLAVIHVLQGVLWLSFVAWLATGSRLALDRPRVGSAVERLTGVVLVGLGARLALDGN
jgi:threonine/homoserine/homoserine lactone efflux protein